MKLTRWISAVWRAMPLIWWVIVLHLTVFYVIAIFVPLAFFCSLSMPVLRQPISRHPIVIGEWWIAGFRSRWRHVTGTDLPYV